jgi:hypothetical protein
MSLATLDAIQRPPAPAELVPRYFDTDLVVTPEDNPVYPPATLADLLESVREHGQLVPGWVCPSPDLQPDKRLCIEGNRRLAVRRQLGQPFWAFDLGRPVPEEERIKLTFQHNHSRRVMSRDEIAEKAARYIELTGCSHGEAALHLKVSHPTLSRAFGERRIPPELKPRADRLGLSVRSLVAAVPVALMERVIAHAESPGPDGRKPTRDQLSTFIGQLKKGGQPKANRPKVITLRLNARTVTLAVSERDTVADVTKDLNALIARLAKHADVPPDGWPFLFQ